MQAEKDGSERLLKNYPDIHFQSDEMIAEDEKVVVFTTRTGTNKSGEEKWGIPPDKRFTLGVVDVVRVSGGRIVEDTFFITKRPETID